MTEIQSLKQQIIDQLELAEEMTDYDAYSFLQQINNTAWRYIIENYDNDYKIGSSFHDKKPIT